ncbi:MAG: hypothetical protein Ct9H300mP27_10130 [Chloroflexota bacterium]|nr:MAG: hypothetical protein Ct9H300mP27_10130 [Chloroflexota bacterium]
MIQPLRQALVANTVPTKHRERLCDQCLTITGTRLIGPFFGGILIASLGFFWNFMVEGFLYLGNGSGISTNAYSILPTSKKIPAKIFLTDLKEGIVYIWKGERVILHL